MQWPASLKDRIVDRWCECRISVAATFLGLGLSFGPGTGLLAATFEAGGLLFSDELGGFRLLSARGQGTASDPIVLVEEIASLNPSVLTIRQIDTVENESFPSPSHRILLRSIIKVVVNKSAWRWSGFDLELCGEGGDASIYSDGLSFDQPSASPTPLHSDLFASIRAEDEPHDRIRYDQGAVEPEQTVQIAFNVMDLNPRAVFYLAQEPIVLMTERPHSPSRGRSIYAGLGKRSDAARQRLAKFPMSP